MRRKTDTEVSDLARDLDLDLEPFIKLFFFFFYKLTYVLRINKMSSMKKKAYLVVGACCVGFKWHFSVKMARWSTPRVPFRSTRGVFLGAREVARKPKRTVLKL